MLVALELVQVGLVSCDRWYKMWKLVYVLEMKMRLLELYPLPRVASKSMLNEYISWQHCLASDHQNCGKLESVGGGLHAVPSYLQGSRLNK